MTKIINQIKIIIWEKGGVKVLKIYNTGKDTNKFEAINERRLEIGLLPFEEKNLKFKRGQKICKEKRENKNHKQVRLFYWCG